MFFNMYLSATSVVQIKYSINHIFYYYTKYLNMYLLDYLF